MFRTGMRKLLAAMVAVAFVAAVAGTLQAEDKPVEKQVSGTVMMACPQGKFIKIKTEDSKELLFPVAGDAQQTVKGLKTEEKVKLTYICCPKSGKDTVTKVEKAA